LIGFIAAKGTQEIALEGYFLQHLEVSLPESYFQFTPESEHRKDGGLQYQFYECTSWYVRVIE